MTNTKDKYEYVEKLLKNYKKSKSRIKILELGLVTDDDFTIGAIDYSKDKIQTSNNSDLSDLVIEREKELKKLKYEVAITDALLESLNNRDKYIIEAIYIEKIKIYKIAYKLNYEDVKSVWNNKQRIMSNLMNIV